MQSSSQPAPKSNSRTRWLLLGGGALLVICCACSVLAYLLRTPAASVVSTATPLATFGVEFTPFPGSGATVEVVPPTQAPAPTATAVLGTTRDNPAARNSTVDIGSGMQVTVLDVTRPADDIVAQGNMFNSTPVPDVQEYLIVRLHVECTKPTNEKCSFDSTAFKTVGSDGQVHDMAFVAGIPQEFELFAEFFGGASLTGNIAYLVPKGDPNVVLFHDPLIFGDPVYIALQP